MILILPSQAMKIEHQHQDAYERDARGMTPVMERQASGHPRGLEYEGELVTLLMRFLARSLTPRFILAPFNLSILLRVLYMQYNDSPAIPDLVRA